MDSQQFEIGDHVYIGPAKEGKVHWEVVGHGSLNTHILHSPMSGRHRYERGEHLTLHSRKDAA